MNNYDKIQKAKQELIYYSAKLNTYDGDVNKHKVIKELDKVIEILNK